jgi:uncharacterized protein (DUF58 family)
VNLGNLTQLFSVRDIRNAILGTIVVVGGITLALLTLYASQTNPTLAGILAGVSLVFVLLILIFVVPPLARNAGREASRMNLPFEITGGGAIMLGLLAIVGFSAWNTGNNLLFLVLSFVTAAMIVGFAAGNISLKKLDVKMRFPETIFVEQETPILVAVENHKRLFGSYSVVVDVRGHQRDRSIAADDLYRLLPKFMAERLAQPPIVRRTLDHFVYVPRSGTVEHRVLHIFDRRGRFMIKDFEISSRFPFGFFRHRRRLAAREADLYVFPKLEPFEGGLDAMQLDAGRLSANKRGLGQDLLALRDYQPNDDLRRIDWKATARSRTLTVREFHADDDKRVIVLFDDRMPPETAENLSLREKLDAEQTGRPVAVSEKFERGVSLAASILAHFTEEQAEVCLVIGQEKGEFGIGTRHLYHCLQRLAVVEPRFTESVEPHEADLRILNELDGVYRFMVRADGIADQPSDPAQKLEIIRF